MTDIRMMVADAESPEARWCLGEYFRELELRFEGGFDLAKYGGGGRSALQPPAGWFVVARRNDDVLGCGALIRHPGYGEIKRMWVAPAARGQGVSRRLLAHLEELARGQDLPLIRLDTNRALLEARELYRKAGYHEIARFNDNPYAHHWFEKKLQATEGESARMLKPAETITSVAIIGNGLMGQGIAQVFARAGKRVALVGRNAESLARAMATIRRNIDAFAERGLVSAAGADAAFARITTSTRIEDAGNADHVIEAVPNVRETQIGIFSRLDAVCAPDVVLGSTSGQPISLMTERMAHPGRAVAMHFIYPAQLIPIVEICGGPRTDPAVVQWACDVMKAVGQTPALMNKEVDGFIINRLQFALLREAWSMWANGIASAEAIDNSFKLSLGRRYSVTGPIESAELGGLDVMHKFAEFLLPDLDAGKTPPAAVGELARAGHFGLKTGKGIYDWSARDGTALLAQRADKLFAHMRDDSKKSEG